MKELGINYLNKILIIGVVLFIFFATTHISAQVKSSPESQLNEALKQAREGDYIEASINLFRLSRHPQLKNQRTQIRYILGLMLMELKLNQVASYQFVDVVKTDNKKYIKNSLERLSMIADHLDDDTLLNYAMTRIKVEDFPSSKRDMINYRMGETFLSLKDEKSPEKQQENIRQAILSFKKIDKSSSYFGKSKYLQAYGYAELQQNEDAVNAFDELLEVRENSDITDTNRVAALLGKARVYYQAKNWDKAIEYYRQVPKDSEYWHDTLFEISWALFRSGKFRTALSYFHSLHSSYYDDFYIPESLIVRAIVYLYICKYDEMGKVINLFENSYSTAKSKVSDTFKFLADKEDHTIFYEEIEKIINNQEKISRGIKKKNEFRIPYNVAKKIIKEGGFRRAYGYLGRLTAEKERVSLMKKKWQDSSIGKYAKKAIIVRIQNTRKLLGSLVRHHLFEIKDELRDFDEQIGFLRYEMVNGKKSEAKKKIISKGLEMDRLDTKTDRDYFIQNGFEYWPFQGEYWLDEIGNYHYVGKRSCE